MRKVTLTTSDGISIAGNYFPAEKQDAPAIILLHMMPATKESWDEFIPLLLERGFQALAIDERGHGESTQGGELDYNNFSDEQQQAKMLDVLAAQEFFVDKGIPIDEIMVGGASIGANLAIQYLAESPEARAGFALSPGLNYKGIKTMPLMDKLNSDQELYMAAAKDDPNVPTSWETVEELNDAGPAKKKISIFDTGGHGTDMFKEYSEFMEELSSWLSNFKA